MENNQVSFDQCIKYGKHGEDIFKKDFLDFLDIEYIDVTGCQQFQLIDTDFKAKIGNYEVKLNYKDNEMICIEEYTNIDKSLAPLSYGWWYKSKADLIVFISRATKIMVLLPLNDNMRLHYKDIKDGFELVRNKISTKDGRRWQSAFRRIPLESLKGYYSMYRRK